MGLRVRQRDILDLNILVAPLVEKLDASDLGGDLLGKDGESRLGDLDFTALRHVDGGLTGVSGSNLSFRGRSEVVCRAQKLRSAICSDGVDFGSFDLTKNRVVAGGVDKRTVGGGRVGWRRRFVWLEIVVVNSESARVKCGIGWARPQRSVTCRPQALIRSIARARARTRVSTNHTCTCKMHGCRGPRIPHPMDCNGIT